MINEKYVKGVIQKSHKYAFDSKIYINADDVKDLLLIAMQQQRKACTDAFKPFLTQHIVIQELRELYSSKVANAEVDNDQRT